MLCVASIWSGQRTAGNPPGDHCETTMAGFWQIDQISGISSTSWWDKLRVGNTTDFAFLSAKLLKNHNGGVRHFPGRFLTGFQLPIYLRIIRFFSNRLPKRVRPQSGTQGSIPSVLKKLLPIKGIHSAYIYVMHALILI